MDLYAFALASMGLLEPQINPGVLSRHAELAGAIARRVDVEAPLFRDDEDKRKTAALLVAIAYRESGFRLDAVGDSGTSYCALQVSSGAGGTRAMLKDADLCVLGGFRVLQWSVRSCPAAPVALYASGLRGCAMARARRISRDRMAIAARLVRDAKAHARQPEDS